MAFAKKVFTLFFEPSGLTSQSWLRQSGSTAGEPRGQCISFDYSRTRRHRVNYTISYRAAVAVAVRRVAAPYKCVSIKSCDFAGG